MAHDFNPGQCDIVMEGGVTSGVVYPRFVAELARRFTLRSIGGTSVGAVAAVAAAAAQYRRNASQGNPAAGFRILEDLPAWLQASSADGKSNLFSLFQPCPALRRHFLLLQRMLNRSLPGRLAAAVFFLLLYFPAGPAIALALSTAGILGGLFAPRLMAALPLADTWMDWCFALIYTFGIALFFSAAQFIYSGWKGLRTNRCGICSGMSEPDSRVPALTAWLHQFVQQIAGITQGPPLTFKNLSGSSPSIELAFMTTGLSEGAAHRLPFAEENLMFRKSEMSALFPPEIVDHLVRHAPAIEDAKLIALARALDPNFGAVGADLFRLPLPGDQPIVFAARMSLSFPLLLQAVPLYRIRYISGDGVVKGALDLKRVWFSDGGLTSNFPIHFFDALLPTRPTFGITLDNSLASKAAAAERVVLAKNNSEGLVWPYFTVDDKRGFPDVLQFFMAIIRTVRSWRDESLRRTPGYRDRVVRVRHTRAEGGLNLDMPAEAVQAMSDSGAAAAHALIARFLDPNSATNGWLNHRMVRMRSTTAMLQQTVSKVTPTWTDRALWPNYRQLWNGKVAGMPHAYRLPNGQRRQGNLFWKGLINLNRCITVDLSEGAPRPRPTLEVTPPQH